MDLSERGRLRVAARPAGDAPAATPSTDAVERLQGVLAQIGAEIAGPLTAAMERINALSSTGGIDADSLRALRDEVEAARQAGMIGQQLARFAAGRMRQSHEVLQLADVVRHVLANRQRQTQARGVSLRPNLSPVEVVADPSLLFSLINGTVDWALANAASPIEFTVEARSGAAATSIACRFTQRSPDEATDVASSASPGTLDSLAWRLVEQTAWALGLRIDRRLEAGIGSVVFAFPRASEPEPTNDAAHGANDGFSVSVNSQPLAGSHVLVVASRRELRMRIRDALRSMSLIVDFVDSVDAAAAFCRDGLPHAIVIEAIQSGERFARFRAEIRNEVPGFVFIEIVEDGRLYQTAGPRFDDVARIGREVLTDSLPSALMFELSKGL